MKPYASLTLEDARRDLQHEILRVAVPGLCVYYALMTVAHALYLQGPVRSIMLAVAGATTVGLGALIPFRGREALHDKAHVAAALVAMAVTANSVLHVCLTGEAFQTTNLVLVAIGSAALLTSATWFGIVLVLLVLGWLAAVIAHPGAALWPHFGFALVGAELVAVLVFAVRSAGIRGQFEAERERDRVELARRAAATTALAHESRYRAVVSLSPAAILVHRKGTVRFANRAAAALIGVGKESEIVGSPLFDLFAPGDQERIATWSRGALAEVDEGEPLECRLRALQGEWPYVELSTTAITWEGEQAAILVATDVTARRETARLKDELVAIVGHELRNPVSAALGALELVRLGDHPADAARTTELVELAVRNLERLQVLLDDLLDLEQARAGRLQLAKAPFDLVAVFAQAVAEFAPTAERAGLRIAYEPNEELLGVLGDRGRLVQVLINLLANALHHSTTGQVVRVSVADQGELARVEVEDHGPGIAFDFRDRIFERFSRDPAEGAAEGRGLGLAICKVLVEEHGGEIGFDPSRTDGSTFWFTVPRVALSAVETTRAPAAR